MRGLSIFAVSLLSPCSQVSRAAPARRVHTRMFGWPCLAAAQCGDGSCLAEHVVACKKGQGGGTEVRGLSGDRHALNGLPDAVPAAPAGWPLCGR